jgi:hypothetical protein
MRDDHFKPDALDAPRPTPETDARRKRNGNVLCGEANLDLCARLERERDEAREAFSAQVEEWHKVKEQRDKLEACLAHLRKRDWFTDDTIHREVICGLDADMVREALNSLKP